MMSINSYDISNEERFLRLFGFSTIENELGWSIINKELQEIGFINFNDSSYYMEINTSNIHMVRRRKDAKDSSIYGFDILFNNGNVYYCELDFAPNLLDINIKSKNIDNTKSCDDKKYLDFYEYMKFSIGTDKMKCYLLEKDGNEKKNSSLNVECLGEGGEIYCYNYFDTITKKGFYQLDSYDFSQLYRGHIDFDCFSFKERHHIGKIVHERKDFKKGILINEAINKHQLGKDFIKKFQSFVNSVSNDLFTNIIKEWCVNSSISKDVINVFMPEILEELNEELSLRRK